MSIPPPPGARPPAHHPTATTDLKPRSVAQAVVVSGIGIWNAIWPAALAGATLAAFGYWQRDPGQRPEALYLAASVAWVTALCGLAIVGRWRLSPTQARTHTSLPLLLIGAICALVGWSLHYGPHRGAWIGLMLSGALGFAATRLWQAPSPSWIGITSWALAVQSFVRGDLLLAPYSDLLSTEQLPWILIIMPLIAGVLIRGLAWAGGSAGAMAVACGTAAAGPGWTQGSLTVLAVLTAGGIVIRWRGASSNRWHDLLAQPELRWTAAIFMSALLVPSAYPWFRPTPLLAWFELFQGSPWPFLAFLLVVTAMAWPAIGLDRGRWRIDLMMTVAGTAAFCLLTLTTLEGPTVLIDRHTEILSHAQFRVELPISSDPISTVILETDLVHGAALEPGTKVFRIYIDSENQRLVDEAVYAGSDTDDWASGRPDLARQDSPAAPAWSHRVTDDGQFFRQTFRTVVPLEKPVQGRRLILRRFDTLPKDVVIRIHRLETLP